jgi:flagellar biosynthesis/type III secretory pathway protein FliH
MREDQNLAQIASMMSLHFVEIPKLIKCLNTGIALTENFALTEWCKFLYNPASPVKDEVFASMPPLKKARKTLESISANEAAREIARQREKGFRDYISDIHYARETGRAEGKAEGKAEGIAVGKAKGIAVGKAEGIAVGKAEGIAVGKAEGKTEERLRILEQLLTNPRTASMPAQELASLCGLSVDEVVRAMSNIRA